MRLTVLFGIFSFLSFILSGQDQPKMLIRFDHDQVFAGMMNTFTIVARQGELITVDELTAAYWTFDSTSTPIIGERIPIGVYYGSFSITPRKVGNITIKLKTASLEDSILITVDPIPAVIRMGTYGKNTRDSIPLNVFKAQAGIYAPIHNLDISARCRIISYELIRVRCGEDAKTIVNDGGAYQSLAKDLVLNAQRGDHFHYRNIRYRCPGAEIPQAADDLFFILK